MGYPKRNPQKGITQTHEFLPDQGDEGWKLKNAKNTNTELIQSAASLRVKSEDSNEDLDAARRESKAPTLGKTKHHENQGLKSQNHNQRRGRERNQHMDEISTRKSFYFIQQRLITEI